MKTISAATLVVTKARVLGSALSDRGRINEAMPSSTGRTPMPIASAPKAQLACSKIRYLNSSIVLRHAVDA